VWHGSLSAALAACGRYEARWAIEDLAIVVAPDEDEALPVELSLAGSRIARLP
jgi:hypothetical protein